MYNEDVKNENNSNNKLHFRCLSRSSVPFSILGAGPGKMGQSWTRRVAAEGQVSCRGPEVSRFRLQIGVKLAI